MDNIETRLKALEYELSQIVESDYLNELNKYPNQNLRKDVIINIIPSRDISFKTRTLLSDILDRLELTRQDRQDLEKYIIYGGGENIEYIKSTIGDLLNKVPELNYLIDNIQTVIPLLNKLDELFKDADENLDSFKELYDTLKLLKTSINNLNTTHNNDIKKINDAINTINQKINNDVVLKKDAPFEKGSAENSAVLKDGNNQVISENGVAIGVNNIVGLKGFYYKHIRFVNTKLANVYLSKTQVIPTITTGGEIKDTSINPFNYYSIGDVISIINDSKYDNIAVINNMSNGMIQIKWNNIEAPFNQIIKETNLSPEDYSIYSLDNPIYGLIDIGKYSFANGSDNKAINSYTEVSGKGNIARSKFAKVWGKNNVGGYNTTTCGTNNINTADNSFVSGTNNTNKGSNSVIHGNFNENVGKRAFVVGHNNRTKNINEVAIGEFNTSHVDKTLYSIGIGTSNTNRKNAHEVTQEGNHYIYGIGGYDGTNPTTAKSVQEVINELVNKLNEITTND